MMKNLSIRLKDIKVIFGNKKRVAADYVLGKIVFQAFSLVKGVSL